MGWAGVASFAGLSNDGVPGGDVGGPEVTVRMAERLAAGTMAVIVTWVFAETWVVVTVKLAEVWPSGTVIAPGGVATKLLVESVTETPPAGAGALRKTVPVEAVPPCTLVGLSDTDCSSGGAFGSGPR